MFNLVSKFNPSGDQPQAIEKLVNGIKNGEKNQVLLGATGTGKTFTIDLEAGEGVFMVPLFKK